MQKSQQVQTSPDFAILFIDGWSFTFVTGICVFPMKQYCANQVVDDIVQTSDTRSVTECAVSLSFSFWLQKHNLTSILVWYMGLFHESHLAVQVCN